MLMEKMGYILSEAPVFILVVWFAVRVFQFRRRRNKQPAFSESDRQLLFGVNRQTLTTPKACLKLALAILATAAAGFVELITLAPLGGAILTAALLLTSAAIVHQAFPVNE
jgi:hypothetical protein